MATGSTETGKVKFYTPPNVLREKVGYGGIDPQLLDKAQLFLDKNDLDFAPYADGYLKRLKQAIDAIKADKVKGAAAVDSLVRPIMELKANGGMFRYRLVTEIAGVILNFLEDVKDLNKDALRLVEVHYQTIHVIVSSGLRGDGGAEGRLLAEELYDACVRYYNKYDGVVSQG
ncbi:MAG: hypothetical protein H6868_09030 [Rhodospirillales bacterium]|nr:hypothetical protein [Rhodospirillales bacterium]